MLIIIEVGSGSGWIRKFFLHPELLKSCSWIRIRNKFWIHNTAYFCHFLNLLFLSLPEPAISVTT